MNQASKVAHTLAQKIAQLELQNTILSVDNEELKELNQALTKENEKLKGGD